jgi:hypothetical protein
VPTSTDFTFSHGKYLFFKKYTFTVLTLINLNSIKLIKLFNYYCDFRHHINNSFYVISIFRLY